MIEVNNQFVTFIPPQDAVYLIGDFTDWDERPLPIKDKLTIEFPFGAYVEYGFLDTEYHPIANRDNPCKPKNPWYDYHRAIILPRNAFTEPPRPTHFRGTIDEQKVDSRYLSVQKTYYVYEPTTQPKATIYVQDGEGFHEKLHFPAIAEALLEREEIEPVRLVLIVPHRRETEYWFNEGYESFLIHELMPEIGRRYGETEEQALWGASLGGLVSSWMAWRNPSLFTKVGSMSGCFTAHPQGNDEYHDPEWLTEQFAETPARNMRFYVQTGQIEWLLAPNRRFAAMLKDKGYPHYYQELPSGHNWATWEQGLEPGLRYLFGK